ncbi:MAG: CDP-alcohol phosphatidyltransferase family protein [Kofleriaceae bacterium]
MVPFDAVVIADDPLARIKIAGLPARERARRVAQKVGAQRVFLVENADDRARIVAWRRADHALLVISANQLVHTPLVEPVIERIGDALVRGAAIAVDPDDNFVGAYLVVADRARDATVAIARGDDTASFIASPARVVHGDIARHSIATPADRAAAHKLLYRILVKPQDNVITRYLYRPVSFPLTRFLVWTPITPNQVSFIVAAMVAIGCWLTFSADFARVISGTVLILAASYVDCCDGEVARVKLMSSRFGAWMDTVVDELSSVGYMIAIGYHCHLHFGRNYFGDLGVDPWLLAVWISIGTYAWCMYCIYYNIIVAVGSANSQDYVGRFEAVPGTQPGTVRLRPAAAKAIVPTKPLPKPIAWLATYAPYIVRRDFIAWLAVFLAVAHLTHIAFGMFAIGGVISFVILTRDHVALRRLRRSVVRSGQVIESPA